MNNNGDKKYGIASLHDLYTECDCKRQVATALKHTRGQFHKSWVQGANHRDSSIHLRPLPTPNFLRIFLRRKSWAQGRRAQKQFMKSTPGHVTILN